MKYPIILKYTYSYICSGNYYKPEVREYYQLFRNINDSTMVSLGAVTDIKVNVTEFNGEQIIFTYKYSKYCKPDTFDKKTEWVNNYYAIKKGEKVSIICVEQYWAYARGGENSPANLTVEWVSYEEMLQEIFAEAEKDKYKAIKVANILIKEEIYDLAFKMLLSTKMYSYELGLCYEKGYGTEIDLDKALDNYLDVGGYDAERGIERIFRSRGKRIEFDEVKETIIYVEKGDYQKAYFTAVIPTEKKDNTLKNMRKNVELHVIKFLELGKPFNNPFSHRTDDMSRLATYYDVINNVPVDQRPKYHTVKYESDPYDGGEFMYDIYYDDLIKETLQKEAKKNDVIALGCLLVQYASDFQYPSYRLENLDEIKDRLINVAETSTPKEKGMANYFLGLYYEREEKDINKSHFYFEEALKCDFYIAVAHLAEKIVQENPKNALKILGKYKKYIPCIRDSATKKYYDLIEKLSKGDA